MSQSFVLHKGDDRRTVVLSNLHAFLDKLPDTKSWQVEVKQYRKKRSNPQCRYLNGIAYKLLGDHLGYERDEISEFLCGHYFGWVDKESPDGYVVRKPIRTTTTNDGERDVMETKDFADYVKFVQRFAAEQGCYIPDPEPEIPDRGR